MKKKSEKTDIPEGTIILGGAIEVRNVGHCVNLSVGEYRDLKIFYKNFEDVIINGWTVIYGKLNSGGTLTRKRWSPWRITKFCIRKIFWIYIGRHFYRWELRDPVPYSIIIKNNIIIGRDKMLKITQEDMDRIVESVNERVWYKGIAYRD